MAKKNIGNDEPCCSFCGKSESKVEHLIAAPGDNVYICNDCVAICREQLQEHSETLPDKVALLPPEELKTELDKYIIGQDDAKRVLSVAVYNHYKRVNYNLRNVKGNSRERDDERTVAERNNGDGVELNKSNILMFGPSGCGKTLLAQTLSKILKVPFAMVDATTLTEAGYVGEDVENILLRLIKNADYDVAAAERGIIYIDEVDKIARKSENVSITRDVSGEGVQQSLLKIIESTVSSIPPNGGRKHPQQEFIHMDTTNVLFILGGAFVGLDKIVSDRLGKTRIGFGGALKSETTDPDAILPQVQPQDLIKFGLIPELVGRVPVTVALKDLKSEDLVRVLTEPKNAIVKQYVKLLDLDGVQLEFDNTALKAIADKAISLHTGARGLRTIVENAMLDIMYKVPSDKTIKKIIITSETIERGAPPKVVKDAA
ncbi:ATP-dependent Clp protease ATP-binding subunit ClpX [Anaerocaecibacter muris]|uniref:ATP-dependent Clp protease ATP-binding subunit ClpX n=1 Tax=Anaerocaecibacter muris TaxID=2941513 RepID=UPI00203DD53C|nr:ATP-dependent Clp protease ATP-binding subunit ClpX [Anaerocaecibacter muris]